MTQIDACDVRGMSDAIARGVSRAGDNADRMVRRFGGRMRAELLRIAEQMDAHDQLMRAADEPEKFGVASVVVRDCAEAVCKALLSLEPR